MELDHILKEHLLKTIPSRIREIMGKEVEQMTSEEVAKTADTFFDRQGKPVEKQPASVSQITSATASASSLPPPSTSSSSSPFTHAYSDEDDNDVNHIRRGRFQGNGGGRFNNRGPRSKSRNNFSRAPTTSSTAPSSSNAPQQATQPKLCRWHRKFGDKSLKCLSDCSRHASFMASQKSGNGQGGRRL